jgi:hypothetical protein
VVGFFLKNTPNGNARNDGMFHPFVTQIEACTNENVVGSEPFDVKNFPKAAIEKKRKTVFSGIRNVFDMTFMCEIEIYHCPNYRPTMRELPKT